MLLDITWLYFDDGLPIKILNLQSRVAGVMDGTKHLRRSFAWEWASDQCVLAQSSPKTDLGTTRRRTDTPSPQLLQVHSWMSIAIADVVS